MTRGVRIGLVLLGVVLVATGGVGAALAWSDVALTAFIVAGVFVLIGAVVGVFPRGSFKEGTLEWPEVDKHPRVEAIEAEVAALRADVTAARKEAKDATDFLIDYILAHEPPPVDEDGPLTDEERLRELEQAEAELSQEISVRYFTGEGYDDGVDVKQLEQWRDRTRKNLAREERRQAARVRFGLPLNDEQRPVKRA
jgi:hypothetical protein